MDKGFTRRDFLNTAGYSLQWQRSEMISGCNLWHINRKSDLTKEAR